jgi:hypothetical protein
MTTQMRFKLAPRTRAGIMRTRGIRDSVRRPGKGLPPFIWLPRFDPTQRFALRYLHLSGVGVTGLSGVGLSQLVEILRSRRRRLDDIRRLRRHLPHPWLCLMFDAAPGS